VIRGVHGLFYTSQPEAARAFVRDKLQLPYADVGGGWLIFDVPEAEIGFHPIKGSGERPSGTHELSFYCDDIKGTVASLKKRGVVFDKEISDEGFGLVTNFTIPGGIKEPKYAQRKPKTNRRASYSRKVSSKQR
jgi:hypothetical protein